LGLTEGKCFEEEPAPADPQQQCARNQEPCDFSDGLQGGPSCCNGLVCVQMFTAGVCSDMMVQGVPSRIREAVSASRPILKARAPTALRGATSGGLPTVKRFHPGAKKCCQECVMGMPNFRECMNSPSCLACSHSGA
jgi:hypothetical protein